MEEIEKIKESYMLSGVIKNREQNRINLDINRRLELLEEKLFKKPKRLRATEAQRFLIDYHLGFIQTIQELPISQNQKDLLVSVKCDIDPDNARKFLAETNSKNRPKLDTYSNYSFLVEYFTQIGLTDKAHEVELHLVSIIQVYEDK